MSERYLKEEICAHCGERRVIEGSLNYSQAWPNVVTATGKRMQLCIGCAADFQAQRPSATTVSSIRKMLRELGVRR